MLFFSSSQSLSLFIYFSYTMQYKAVHKEQKVHKEKKEKVHKVYDPDTSSKTLLRRTLFFQG